MSLLQDYVEQINKRLDDEKEALARGSASSFEDYKRRLGIISGLNLAMTVLEDLLKTLPKEDR